MPKIDPTLIPLVNPGNLFPVLTKNDTLSVRFLVAKDPHYFDVYNRPMGDIVVRQLIMAKSIDQLGLRLSYQSNFPFLVTPTVNVGTSKIQLPLSWIWDMQVSLPDTWENLRLARIQRFAGNNDVTNGDFDGIMRLIFTANQIGSSAEVGMFYVDYDISSSLTFQIRDIKPATITEDQNPIPDNQHDSIAGFVVLRTLDTEENEDFFLSLEPPVIDTTGNITGVTDLQDYISYEISNTPPGGSGVENDFSSILVSHGTGLLVVNSYNVIPPIGVNEDSVLTALNYPWRSGTNLNSVDSKCTLPSLMFSQFTMTAPMGDRGESSDENFPVILTRVRRKDSAASELEFVFSTYNTIIGSTSDSLVEFASVVIPRNGKPNDVFEIEPLYNLRDNVNTASVLFHQNFGSGFVILDESWSINTAIDDFYKSFESIVDEPADRAFVAQLNEFALHRTPFNIPTIGEAQALAGSTSRRETPLYPSDDNRYICENDQGLGDTIDFIEIDKNIEQNTDISPVGYSGTLVKKSVTLLVNTANDAKFNYNSDILPRLKILFGRDPIHGDEWFDGTTFKRYDGISESWIG